MVDAFNVLYRAFHALPHFTSPDGRPTNAVFGFARMVQALMDEIEPDYVAIATDLPSEEPSFRQELIPEYKANPVSYTHLPPRGRHPPAWRRYAMPEYPETGQPGEPTPTPPSPPSSYGPPTQGSPPYPLTGPSVAPQWAPGHAPYAPVGYVPPHPAPAASGGRAFGFFVGLLCALAVTTVVAFILSLIHI